MQISKIKSSIQQLKSKFNPLIVMKTKFFFGIFVTIVTLCVCSCESERDDHIKEIKFRKADIVGATTLALASESGEQAANAPHKAKGSSNDEEDPSYSVSNPLYKVSEDGTLVEVTYVIEVDGDDGETAKQVEANMRLVMEYVYAVGNDWLWLVNCRYDYPGIEDAEEPLRGKILEFLNKRKEERPLNFLVRKSDGALFNWKSDEGFSSINPYGSAIREPSDVIGQVEQIGKDLYSVASRHKNLLFENDTQPGLYKLADNGNELAVQKITGNDIRPTNILPTNDGYIGVNVYYDDPTIPPKMVIDDTEPPIPSIIFLSDYELINLPQPESGHYNLCSINGKLYIIHSKYSEGRVTTDFRKPIIENSPTKSVTAGEIIATADCQPTMKSICKGSTMSWLADGKAYTFSPEEKTLTIRILPEHYSSFEYDYYDGVAYLLNGDATYFWVCDMAKDEAERVDVVWDGVEEYRSKIAMSTVKFLRYSPSFQGFASISKLNDGRNITLVIPAIGEDKGKIKAIVSGENTVGQVVSVMVRLN